MNPTFGSVMALQNIKQKCDWLTGSIMPWSVYKKKLTTSIETENLITSVYKVVSSFLILFNEYWVHNWYINIKK